MQNKAFVPLAEENFRCGGAYAGYTTELRRIIMIDYMKELSAQLNDLRDLIKRVEKRKQEYNKLPKGSIRVTSCRGVKQYYLRNLGSNKEEYISSQNKEQVRLMLQREYDEKLIKELYKQEKRLERFLKNHDIARIDSIYENMCAGRKELVTPVKPTQEMRVNKWLDEHQGQKNTISAAPLYKTNKGEMVRSKSEKILADYFYNLKIPYAYESSFMLHDGRVVYPDFALYSVRKDKTVYWEHLGLVDNPEYAIKNIKKLIDYEKSGLILGDTLLLSAESAESPLNLEAIKKKVEAVL